MIGIKIKIDNKELLATHPEKWEEFTITQFTDVAPLLSQEVITLDERYNIIQSLISFSDKQIRRIKDLEGFQIDELLKLHAFVFNDIPFDKWIIKQFLFNNKEYFGPDDNFRNVSWDEFVYCDTMLMSYCKTEREDTLNKLIAIMYRVMRAKVNIESPEFTGDVREDFNENTINIRAELLNKLDDKIKLSVLFNLRSFRKTLETQYPRVFQHQEQEEKKNKKQASNTHWGHITRQLCDLADLNKIGKMPMHNILFELNERLKENKK